MTKKILIIVCLIQFFLILILLGINTNSDIEFRRSNILDVNSPDNNYRIIVNEIGEAPPLGSSKVELIVAKKVDNEWSARAFIKFDVANEGKASKDNFWLEWFSEGVIIHVMAKEQPNCAYRVYWNDLFENI